MRFFRIPARHGRWGANARALAFSLIEVVGALAVIAILATVIFSATTKSVDAGFANQESATLKSFADALQESVLRNRYIPGQTDWYQQIAEELGLSTNSVLYNARNIAAPRAFMIATDNLSGGLPYQQSSGGTTNNRCRLMIVSSLGPPLPANGVDSANFEPVWNTPPGTLPTTGFSSWGSPDDLKIQRVNLAPLFVLLRLTNSLPATEQGRYVIDGALPMNIVPAVGTNAYFFKTTRLQLLDENSNTNANVMLSRDSSYFYVDNVWRNVPYVPVDVRTNDPVSLRIAQTMSAVETTFASSPRNLNAAATPALVATKLSAFMQSYTNFTANGSPPSGPVYDQALTAQTDLESALLNLMSSTQPGQCGP